MKKRVFRERHKVTEEVVQAVANAIVEQATVDNKTIEEVKDLKTNKKKSGK